MQNLDVEFTRFLSWVIADDQRHGRWLNTLSLMENVGARKISAGQSKIFVTEQILRHSFEEARHAWYLKRQIGKLKNVSCPNYANEYLFAPRQSAQYLHRLDIAVARQVKNELGLTGEPLKHVCYLLVTYAIEMRADLLYGVYESLLNKAGSLVSLRSIIAEESGHLEEMESALAAAFDEAAPWLNFCLEAESVLFSRWCEELRSDVRLFA